MDDPLTTEEKEKWWRLVREQFDKHYESALASGALSEHIHMSKGDHTVARCVLIITADEFEPLSPTGKEMLRNLRLMI